MTEGAKMDYEQNTLRYITTVKVSQLEKHFAFFNQHVNRAVELAEKAKNDYIAGAKSDCNAGAEGIVSESAGLAVKLVKLNKEIKEWKDKDFEHVTSDPKWLECFVAAAFYDPCYDASVLTTKISKIEQAIQHAKYRYEQALLYSKLVIEWLDLVDKNKQTCDSNAMDSAQQSATAAAIADRCLGENKEEAREKYEKLMFAPETKVDKAALRSYLDSFFQVKSHKMAIADLRENVEEMCDELLKTPLDVDKLQLVILSLLATDILSENHQESLKRFLSTPSTLKEITGVMNMQLRTLDSWQWENKEPNIVHVKRQTNGRVRTFLDTELLSCLLFHYVGVYLSVRGKQLMEAFLCTSAWKKSKPTFTKEEYEHRFQYSNVMAQCYASGWACARNEHKKGHAFLTRLPSSFEGIIGDYDGVSPTDAKQILQNVNQENLKMSQEKGSKDDIAMGMIADVLMTRAMHGGCTVMCADIEAFGPSLSHDTMEVVLEFFGFKSNIIKFIMKLMKCSIVVDGTACKEPREIKAGFPSGYALGHLCGELTLFLLELSVNHRTTGDVRFYRFFDDMYLWHRETRDCQVAWTEMNKCLNYMGLQFNQKCGHVVAGPIPGLTGFNDDASLSSDDDEMYVKKEKTGKDSAKDCHKGEKEKKTRVEGEGEDLKSLPEGPVRHGLMVLNEEAKFVVDEAMLDQHIGEMARQLAVPQSVFEWVSTYNKFMKLIVGSCLTPCQALGRNHLKMVIGVVCKVQRRLFTSHTSSTESSHAPDWVDVGAAQGSFVTYLKEHISSKFGVDAKVIHPGWVLFPRCAGGLGVFDALGNLTLCDEFFGDEKRLEKEGAKIKSGDANPPFPTPEEVIQFYFEEEKKSYKNYRQQWKNVQRKKETKIPFLSFEDFIKGREVFEAVWARCFDRLTRTATSKTMGLPEGSGLDDCLKSFGVTKSTLEPYWRLILQTYGSSICNAFGSMRIIDPDVVPVEMAELVRKTRMQVTE